MCRKWYIYNGESGATNEATTGNYSCVGSLPNCNGGTQLCAVYAVCGGDQPLSLSSRLKGYFPFAKTNQSYYPNGPGEMPYVYVRI